METLDACLSSAGYEVAAWYNSSAHRRANHDCTRRSFDEALEMRDACLSLAWSSIMDRTHRRPDHDCNRRSFEEALEVLDACLSSVWCVAAGNFSSARYMATSSPCAGRY